jgi:hypothetical protein
MEGVTKRVGNRAAKIWQRSAGAVGAFRTRANPEVLARRTLLRSTLLGTHSISGERFAVVPMLG